MVRIHAGEHNVQLWAPRIRLFNFAFSVDSCLAERQSAVRQLHIAVGNIEFAWDRRKARSNLAKHVVSFEEAQSVFLDESARLIDDPDRIV